MNIYLIMKKTMMAIVLCGGMLLLASCASHRPAVTPKSAWLGWLLLTTTDSMSGETSGRIVAAWSENEISGWDRSGKIMLGVWCSSGDIYIHAGIVGGLDADGFYVKPHQNMRYGFDDECCGEKLWQIWDSNYVADLPFGTGNSIIREMMERSQLFIEVRPFNTAAGQRVDFDLSGFNEVHAQCRE